METCGKELFKKDIFYSHSEKNITTLIIINNLDIVSTRELTSVFQPL